MPEADKQNQDIDPSIRKEILLRLAGRIEAGQAGKLDLVSLFRMLDVEDPVAWFSRHGNPLENIEAAGLLMKSALTEDEARGALALCLTAGSSNSGPGLFLAHSLKLLASRLSGDTPK